jgi:two-component system chemotaxis response regulator CheB
MTVRTLIVDDSPTMRRVISNQLAADGEIQVIGAAANASEARQMIRDLDPDVVTLDIEMPGMDGLDFLDKIMRLRPTPVVMVSTLTAKGAEATIRALSLGAVDCYEKPTELQFGAGDMDGGKLAQKVKVAALCKTRMQGRMTAPLKAANHNFRWNGRMIAIAASTGGVEALGSLLSTFPANCPPTLIVQHMPPFYTTMLARSLNAKCAATVVEAADDMPILQGHIYIAPSGDRHLMVQGGSNPKCVLVANDPVNGHRPSGDPLFQSIAALGADRGVGLVLTGMGEDGARGLKAMRSAGIPTIAQSSDSALIYGMPRAAFEMGGAAEVLALEAMPDRLLELCAC